MRRFSLDEESWWCCFLPKLDEIVIITMNYNQVLRVSLSLLCRCLFVTAAPNGVARVGRKIPTVAEMFPSFSSDVTRIKWAHGITSRKALEQGLNGDVLMLEADVFMGTLKGQGHDLLPVMAHPPVTASDLSLEEFLDRALSPSVKKGIKLDFKGLNVVEKALQMLKQREQQINVPLWLNADILPGPVDARTVPLDADVFLQLCQKYFPDAVISVGWTTRFGPDLKDPNFVIKTGSYSKEHVETMHQTLTRAGVKQGLTFPVRAGIAADEQSQTNLIWLLEKFPESTLTLWSSSYDSVDVPNIVSLIHKVGKHRVYIDVPTRLRCEISTYDSLATGSLTNLVIRRRFRGLSVAALMTGFACRVIHKPWSDQEK